MNRTAAETIDASQCPLCGRPNDCQLCTIAAYKGTCWCAKVTIPEELLSQVPEALTNKNCICQACVMAFHRTKNAGATASKVIPGDFYFDGGSMVFTAAYHLRRGYCCDSGCRHCPYQPANKQSSCP
ncbi:MAG TPA: cysteine-rich CWC family protein [Verrucomicrobiae bacterium]|jgi:hypothetical protein